MMIDVLAGPLGPIGATMSAARNSSSFVPSLAVFPLLLLSSVGLSAQTEAAGGPAWKWETGHVRTWYLENDVQLPVAMTVTAPNKEARMGRFQTRMVLACQPKEAVEAGDTRLTLRCDVVDASIIGVPVEQDEGKLGPILALHGSLLEQATVELDMKENGELRGVALRDIPKVDRSSSERAEQLRLIVSRAVAGLDLQLSEGPSEWVQKEVALSRYPSPTGTNGHTRLTHKAAPGPDGTLAIRSTGKAAFSLPGIASPNNFVSATSGAGAMIRADIGSVALFDEAGGALRSRVWWVNGELTASASDVGAVWVLADGRPAWRSYAQVGVLTLLPDGAPAPSAGESGESTLLACGAVERAEQEAMGLAMR